MECSGPAPCHRTDSGGPSTTLGMTQGALEAILFREILKPLAAGLGPVGEIAVGSVADTLFARPKP